jgi:hypothetical protein
LFAFSTYFERFGAMHIQLYSTTNHIIWHLANGISGIIYIALVLPLYILFGVYAFPLGQIIANLMFYDWYSIKHSKDAFNIKIYDFEKTTSLPPFLFLCIFMPLNIILN